MQNWISYKEKDKITPYTYIITYMTEDLTKKKRKSTRDIYDYIHYWRYYKEKETKRILKRGRNNSIKLRNKCYGKIN